VQQDIIKFGIALMSFQEAFLLVGHPLSLTDHHAYDQSNCNCITTFSKNFKNGIHHGQIIPIKMNTGDIFIA